MESIENILKYAKTLKGIKYTRWKEGPLNKEPYPFYIENIPKKSYIKKYGINCTGLINLLRQKAGMVVPGEGEYRGGTVCWYNYLKNKKALEVFDDSKDYPLGTLFLRKYRNINDQGHVAVYIKKNKYINKTLYGKIIHAHSDYQSNNGVDITILGKSHFWLDNGYYEFAILPDKWLYTK